MVMKILIPIFFFEIKESKITRGHNYTLVKKQSRLDVIKYSFSQRTINVLNKLAGHPRSSCPARLRGHKGSGLWKVWTVPSPPLHSPALPCPALPCPPSPPLPPSLPPSRVPNLIKLGPAVWPKLQARV